MLNYFKSALKVSAIFTAGTVFGAWGITELENMIKEPTIILDGSILSKAKPGTFIAFYDVPPKPNTTYVGEWNYEFDARYGKQFTTYAKPRNVNRHFCYVSVPKDARVRLLGINNYVADKLNIEKCHELDYKVNKEICENVIRHGKIDGSLHLSTVKNFSEYLRVNDIAKEDALPTNEKRKNMDFSKDEKNKYV
jgi:hypothetical protein